MQQQYWVLLKNPTLKQAPAKQQEMMIWGRIQSILSNCPTEDLHKYKQMQTNAV